MICFSKRFMSLVLISTIFLSMAWLSSSCVLSSETVPSSAVSSREPSIINTELVQGGNLHYQNRVLEINDQIYFTSSEGYLCRAQKDGTSSVILLEESAGNLANDEERLYYTEADQAGALVKVNLDGSSSVRIRHSAVKYLICSQEYLYAIEVNTGMPIKISKDGTGRTLLSEFQAVALAMSDGKLYISGAENQSGLLVLDTLTDTRELMFEYKIASLNVTGKYLYYSLPSDQYHLHAFSMEEKSDLSISRFSIDKPFIIYKDHLYFICPEQHNRLYRLAIDGDAVLDLDQAELMVDDLVDSFVILSDHIYYQRPSSNRIYRVSISDRHVIRIT